MKRFVCLTIPLLLAFSFGGIAASAAVNDPIYPESDEDFIRPLYLSSLTDYAIEDELFAFADGNSVKVISGGDYDRYDYDADISAVDIEDGAIYCLSGDKSYLIEIDGENYEFVESEHTFLEMEDRILYGDYLYFTNSSGLNIFDTTRLSTATYDGEYSNLKLSGGKVYAMSGNSLYVLSGTNCKKVELEYEVKAKNVKIEIGQALASLKQYSSVQFVKIKQGTVLTEIDLSKVEGMYFVSKNIVRANENEVALLLCSSEDLAVVAIKNRSYAILNPTSKISLTAVEHSTEVDYDAQSMSENIYASPFVANGTASFSRAMGATVKVISKIESEILGYSFCEVEYQDGENTVKGFIAEHMLNEEIREDKNEPSNITDPNYTESSNTKTILIILAVILLVLVAVLYVAHVSGKGKKKKKKKSEAEEKEE